jgi:hypothetical protein
MQQEFCRFAKRRNFKDLQRRKSPAIYYLSSQKAKQEKVLGKLKDLLLIIDILINDKKSILVALNSEFKDLKIECKIMLRN